MKWGVGLLIFCVHRLPQDGPGVRKHVGEILIMSCVLWVVIYCILLCVLVGQYIELISPVHIIDIQLGYHTYGWTSLSSLTLGRGTICNLLPPIFDSRPLKIGTTGCPEMSVRNYHNSLCNNSKEHSSMTTTVCKKKRSALRSGEKECETRSKPNSSVQENGL